MLLFSLIPSRYKVWLLQISKSPGFGSVLYKVRAVSSAGEPGSHRRLDETENLSPQDWIRDYMKEVGLHLPVYQAQFYLGVSLVLYIPTAVSPEPCDRDVNELVIS